MALKVELKPGERILIGEAVVTNSDQRSRLLIEGAAPDPARKGHHDGGAGGHAGQARLSGGPADVHVARTAGRTTTSISRSCATSSRRAQHRPFVDNINNQILTGEMYKALKETKKLIAYEEELLAHASRGTGLRKSSKTNLESA